jgi:hypothetical protein
MGAAVSRKIAFNAEEGVRSGDHLYDVRRVEDNPYSLILLRVINDAITDLHQRRELVSLAHFFFGQDSNLTVICDALSLDVVAIRARAERIVPEIKRYLVRPLARKSGPGRNTHCQRGHLIQQDAKGRRYCSTCSRLRRLGRIPSRRGPT